MDYTGKTILVTGAASGIGLEISKEFASSGGHVIMSDRDEVSGQRAAETVAKSGGVKPLFLTCDISIESQVNALFSALSEQVGRLDIAVNNAGIDGTLGTIDEQTVQNFDAVFNVNVRGTFFCLREEVKLMKRQGHGVVVNIASIAGHVGFGGSPVYTASKHAILGLTKAAALENARSGIRVCAVSPGAVDTDMTNRFTGNNEDNKRAMLSGIPLGRMCSPNEIARGVLFMASSDAALLVGQTLNLDGGWANVKP